MRLWQCVHQIHFLFWFFEESLKCKGTYPNINGKRGTYEQYLKVHNRNGKECYNCGSIIVKEQIGGRGTYYCPKCQK